MTVGSKGKKTSIHDKMLIIYGLSPFKKENQINKRDSDKRNFNKY